MSKILVAQNLPIEKITSREGLPQNDVNVIFQDSDGFLWIGTNDGLTRYDGYSFKNYHYNTEKPNELTSNLIYEIVEDNRKNLWIGTADKGLIQFNLKTEKFQSFYNSNENPDLLSSNHIESLCVSKSGLVWIGTKSGDINILSVKGDSTTIIKPDKYRTLHVGNSIITVIKQDNYGRMWVGTRSGLYLFPDDKGVASDIRVISNRYTKDILITDNEIIICHNNTIRKYKHAAEIRYPQTISLKNLYNPNRILMTSNGELLAATNNGLVLFEQDAVLQNNFTKPVRYVEGTSTNNLSRNQIRCLTEDSSGIIWIGTNGGGLNKLNLKHKGFKHYNKNESTGSLSNNKIRAIYEDREENLWIGTEGGGINFLPKKNSDNYSTGFTRIAKKQPLGLNLVYSIIDLNRTGAADIIAGCNYPSLIQRIDRNYNGLDKTQLGLLRGIKEPPFSMINDRNGNTWFGTYGLSGLYVLKETAGKKVLINIKVKEKQGSISSTNIRSLMEDSYGNIWVGTDNGLNLLLPEEQGKDNPNFIAFRNKAVDKNSLSHNYILPLFQSKNKTIWVGTMGGGLNKIEYNSNPDSIKFKSYTTADGLPNNNIKGILEDNLGFLWISTNRGLSKFNQVDETFTNYDLSDGLQDNEFGELACCLRANGEMVFGGVNGINVFHPNEIITDMTPPKVALTNFQILNEQIAPGEQVDGRIVLKEGINYIEKIKLKYSENSFAISFASLHFSSPENNKFKYMLEGFDNDWIRTDANERFAKYTNLSPGVYTFKVLASNNDGIWTNTPKTIILEIVPPWWRTYLAFAIYGFLFIALIWFFQRYSIIHIRRKNELLMEHFQKEKIEELAQMKLQFFTNISHEFRTPLTLIIGPLDRLIASRAEMTEKQITKNLSVIKGNASVLLKLINQLVDFRKLEQGKMTLNAAHGNIVPFLHNIYSAFKQFADAKSIQYHFSPDNPKIELWFDEYVLERIMYNLLSNAFKFTREGGMIEVKVEENDSYAIIHVIDNGTGIPQNMQKHIFERFYHTPFNESNIASTGIGLSFVKGLIELHKGSISVTSDDNTGTTFTTKIPKGTLHLNNIQISDQPHIATIKPIKTTEEYISLKSSSSNEEIIPETKPGRATVLVIEDNLELSDFIKDSLSGSYNVYTAENGKVGLEKVTELNPDVIITDVMMPEMTGFEVCDKIKNDENICHKIVIMLTAKTAEDSKIEGYSAGADDYISKPFSVSVLLARIENLLHSRALLRNKFKTMLTVEPSEVTTTSMDELFLKRILSIVEENISNPKFTVEQMASDCGFSKFNLNKKLKELTGNTSNTFVREIRLKRAAQLLATGRYSVTDITYEVGFTDLKYFRNCFKDAFGISPSEYIKTMKNAQNEGD